MNSTFFFEKGVVMKKQFDERNLTMVMDFYELTMANGYFKDEDKERKVAFDVFYSCLLYTSPSPRDTR